MFFKCRVLSQLIPSCKLYIVSYFLRFFKNHGKSFSYDKGAIDILLDRILFRETRRATAHVTTSLSQFVSSFGLHVVAFFFISTFRDRSYVCNLNAFKITTLLKAFFLAWGVERCHIDPLVDVFRGSFSRLGNNHCLGSIFDAFKMVYFLVNHYLVRILGSCGY